LRSDDIGEKVAIHRAKGSRAPLHVKVNWFHLIPSAQSDRWMSAKWWFYRFDSFFGLCFPGEIWSDGLILPALRTQQRACPALVRLILRELRSNEDGHAGKRQTMPLGQLHITADLTR
jgi:hypothetical protein